jgi:hypothetical protein
MPGKVGIMSVSSLCSSGTWGARRILALVLVMASLSGLVGCSVAPQSHSAGRDQVLTLAPGDLERYGIALVTPSTVTGQEEERPAVALTLAEVLRAERPGIRVVTLPETLGAVNEAGLADAYRQMYEEYRNTGLFRRETLALLGKATNVRFVAQLKLSGFAQESSGRFSALGFRIIETKRADVRVYLQIWDTSNGSVAWEGLQETTYSRESFSEQRVTLRTVLAEALTELVRRLP